MILDIDVTTRGGRKTRAPALTLVSCVNGRCKNHHAHPNDQTCRVLLCSPVPSLPYHIPEWVTLELGKVLNVKWPNAVSRATVVAMDTCIRSVNNSFLSEKRKGRAEYVDFRYLFMRPGLRYFDPYIAPGMVNNIVKEQWLWTMLRAEVVEKVTDYIQVAYHNHGFSR